MAKSTSTKKVAADSGAVRSILKDPSTTKASCIVTFKKDLATGRTVVLKPTCSLGREVQRGTSEMAAACSGAAGDGVEIQQEDPQMKGGDGTSNSDSKGSLDSEDSEDSEYWRRLDE